MRLRLLGLVVAAGVLATMGGCLQQASSGRGGNSGGGSISNAAPLAPTATPQSEVLDITQPIQVDYHRTVNPDHISPLFTNNPAMTVTWNDSKSVITLTPATRWPGGHPVELVIWNFDEPGEIPFSIAYDVRDEPTGSVSPEVDVGVLNSLNDAQALDLTFNYPIDVNSAVWEGSLVSSLVATWSSDHQQVTLTPSDFWPHGTQTLRLEALTAKWDDPVDTGTITFGVSGTFPQATLNLLSNRLPSDQALVFTFSAAMNPDSVVLKGNIFASPYQSVWNDTHTILTLTPDSVWPYAQTTVKVQAVDLHGDGIIIRKDVIVRDDGITEAQKIELSGSGVGGSSLTIFDSDGTTLVTGHPTYANQTGLVEIYAKNGEQQWALAQTLQASDAAPDSAFGQSVAVSGDYLAVGAPSVKNGTSFWIGAVYVFHREAGNWQQVAKLAASDAPTNANAAFGALLRMQGTTLIVSAPSKPVEGKIDQGAVYVFGLEASQWKELAILQPPPSDWSSAYRLFGFSLALDGDVLVAGASDPYRDQDVYIYRGSNSSWTLETVLTKDMADPDPFGMSVAVSGDTAVISGSVGTVYVYQHQETGWTEQQKLLPRDAIVTRAPTNTSVGISGDVIAMGLPYQPYDATSPVNTGAVYTFARADGVWSQTAKYYGAPATEYDIGAHVLLLEDSILAGSLSLDDPLGLYIFDYP